jgi:hypothetical protein
MALLLEGPARWFEQRVYRPAGSRTKSRQAAKPQKAVTDAVAQP